MQTYVEGVIVEVVIPFTDDANQTFVPSALRAKLYDGDGVLLEDFGAIAVSGTGSQAVSVHANYNQLGDDETRAARVLRVELTKPDTTLVRRSLSYAIEREQSLEVMTNTFLTYEGAEVLAMDFVSLPGWALADEDRRRSALVDAFRRLTAIPMRYWLRDEKGNRLEPEYIIYRDMWPTITLEMFRAFPLHFRSVLRRAQMVEANELLQGDTLGKKQRQGVISETIGESSMTLKGNAVDYGVSSDTLKILTGYIYFNIGLARG